MGKKVCWWGAPCLNWLEQYKEVYGEKNVELEEIESKGFISFEKGNERMYRIWVREKSDPGARLIEKKVS